jgi:hypothetical protein
MLPGKGYFPLRILMMPLLMIYRSQAYREHMKKMLQLWEHRFTKVLEERGLQKCSSDLATSSNGGAGGSAVVDGGNNILKASEEIMQKLADLANIEQHIERVVQMVSSSSAGCGS